MNITPQIRFFRRLKNRTIYFFTTIILIACYLLLLPLSRDYFDWTAQKNNLLSQSTIQLLKSLDREEIIEIKLQSYTASIKLKQKIRQLIRKYQMYQDKIVLEFVDPRLDPEQTRNLGIQIDGEMIISFIKAGKDKDKTPASSHLTELNEKSLSNALAELNNRQQQNIYIISGHGERSAKQYANFDLSDFATIISRQGINIVDISVYQLIDKIQYGDVIVIANPRSDYSSDEASILLSLIKRGHHLLWLLEPIAQHRQLYNKWYGLKNLANFLNIDLKDGVIVDPATQKLSTQRPDIAIISEYPEHPASKNIQQTSLFPQATSIVLKPNNNARFETQTVLQTSANCWLETSAIQGKVRFDEYEDSMGPLPIAISMTRLINQQNQRIIAVGDGDFLSNAYLANGANLSLGVSLANWLFKKQNLILISHPKPQNREIFYTEKQLASIAVVFLFIIPLILFLLAFAIIHKRNHPGKNNPVE